MQYLSEKEMGAYTQSMYDYARLSTSLFEKIFRPKFDWDIYGAMHEDMDDLLNGTPRGECVEMRNDHSYTTLDTCTWCLGKQNKKKQSIH